MAQKSKRGIAFFERGSWYHRFRYYDADYLVRYNKKGGFKTEEEAEASYQVYLNAFEEQKRKLRQKKDESLDLKSYLQNWLQDQKHFEDTTRKVYQYVLGQAFSYMSECKLYMVNENYLNAVIRVISKRTPSYGLKLYELFSMALGDAFSECLIDYNPMIGVKRPDRGKVELHILPSEQKKLFLQYAKCSEWYLEILLGLFCGLKKQEIYNLKFNDFNLNQKTVSIRGKAKREITIPDAVFRELQIRRVKIQSNEFLYGERYYNNDLICCQKNGNYKSQSAFNNALKTICRKAGLPRVTVQDLRDMYAEMMLKSKHVSILVLTGLLGYASIEETYERYSNLATCDFSHNEFINQIFTEEGISETL
ncbi:MAG: tyrosine-type recombinase/integrase [Lachnospiraceae bacterium]|nr:tyrosine-type recombinase/integrase [Lachnospiraceae bacterium]